ncbi:hypothetical protein ACOMHN_067590 [Nucella lapillus]
MSPCILSPDNDNVSNEAQPITGGQSQGIAAQEPKRKKAKSRPASASEGYNIDSCDNNKQLQVNESRQIVLTCKGITDDTVMWRVHHTGGGGTQMGHAPGQTLKDLISMFLQDQDINILATSLLQVPSGSLLRTPSMDPPSVPAAEARDESPDAGVQLCAESAPRRDDNIPCHTSDNIAQ